MTRAARRRAQQHLPLPEKNVPEAARPVVERVNAFVRELRAQGIDVTVELNDHRTPYKPFILIEGWQKTSID